MTDDKPVTHDFRVEPLTPEGLEAIRERVEDRARRLHQSPEYLDTTAEADRRVLLAAVDHLRDELYEARATAVNKLRDAADPELRAEIDREVATLDADLVTAVEVERLRRVLAAERGDESLAAEVLRLRAEVLELACDLEIERALVALLKGRIRRITAEVERTREAAQRWAERDEGNKAAMRGRIEHLQTLVSEAHAIIQDVAPGWTVWLDGAETIIFGGSND